MDPRNSGISDSISRLHYPCLRSKTVSRTHIHTLVVLPCLAAWSPVQIGPRAGSLVLRCLGYLLVYSVHLPTSSLSPTCSTNSHVVDRHVCHYHVEGICARAKGTVVMRQIHQDVQKRYVPSDLNIIDQLLR